jgi:hypothetical protein
MRLFAITVNFFFLFHRSFKRPQLLDFVNHFIGEANYSKRPRRLARGRRKFFSALSQQPLDRKGGEADTDTGSATVGYGAKSSNVGASKGPFGLICEAPNGTAAAHPHNGLQIPAKVLHAFHSPR